MLHPTGLMRTIDDLGRVCVPKEIRERMNFEPGDSLEIFVDTDNGAVCFKPYIEKTLTLDGIYEEIEKSLKGLTPEQKVNFYQDLNSFTFERLLEFIDV